MSEYGTQSNPLRVAIIGAGPTGFYTAEHLFKQKEYVVSVDMFDRLPVPFGLVRYGVAPDHQKIKSVTAVYDRIAQNPAFRFLATCKLAKTSPSPNYATIITRLSLPPGRKATGA